ncbi:MAG: peptide chain release factor N(5)-glutamine methyltransferase [Xanthobacteraceae bacterium]
MTSAGTLAGTGADAFAGHSIGAARRQLARGFRQHGLDAPELDARIIVGHVLGLDHTALAAQSSRVLTAEEAGVIAELSARRLAREPVARIVGRKEFWGLPFKINAETLLPRPETETVVEAALAAVHCGNRKSRALRIVDLGTGSGALLLALLCELPGACGIGTDVSFTALRCARDNAAALDLSVRASFVACDYGTALRGPADLLVSNPPYVARGDIAGLQAEVRDFDPQRALDGGPDGLDGYRAIASDVRRLLAPGGILVVELGQGQLGAVTSLFAATGLEPVTARHDLSGIARAVVMRGPP